MGSLDVTALARHNDHITSLFPAVVTKHNLHNLQHHETEE